MYLFHPHVSALPMRSEDHQLSLESNFGTLTFSSSFGRASHGDVVFVLEFGAFLLFGEKVERNLDQTLRRESAETARLYLMNMIMIHMMMEW